MGVDFHGLAMVVGQPPIRSSTIEERSETAATKSRFKIA